MNERVDHFIAISHEVQDRIQRYYERSSTVIYPGIQMPIADSAKSIESLVPELSGKKYYLSLGRTVPYKRIDLAVEACSRLGLNLLVAGNGSELMRLQNMAGPTIYFLEEFTDEEAQVLYHHCEAFIFPGEEDFGLTVIEAQWHGKPVIAYGHGGVLDTVIDGRTGVLFNEPTAESLVEAIHKQQSMTFHYGMIKEHANKFSNDSFRSSIMKFIDEHIF